MEQRIDIPFTPGSEGATITVGSQQWKASFFDYAAHLKQYFRESVAKFTLEERRKMAEDMRLPVAHLEPVPDEVVTRLKQIHDFAEKGDRSMIQLEIRNVLQLLAGRAEGAQERGPK